MFGVASTLCQSCSLYVALAPPIAVFALKLIIQSKTGGGSESEKDASANTVALPVTQVTLFKLYVISGRVFNSIFNEKPP